MSEFDLYADENKPTVQVAWTTYRLSVPKPSEMKTSEVPFVYVDVEQDGLLHINAERTTWFGNKLTYVDTGSKSTAEMRREVYEWLVEWELAEWHPIGPEDSELFATEKLTGKELPKYGY